MKKSELDKISKKLQSQEIEAVGINIESAGEIIECLYQTCFCICKTAQERSKRLLKTQKVLLKRIKDLESKVGSSKANSKVVEKFLSALPEIQAVLIKDAVALLEGDPAARSLGEVIAAYPGFYAIFVHRIAHQLYQQENFLLARILSEYSHRQTGIDIHPGASIGHSFCIDHGTGIVIGETCIIGNNVKLYQGVTLGGLSVSKPQAGNKRHPTIEAGVVIYANATILGGKTIIGAHSTIGANVWLTDSVPANSKVFHQPKVSIKTPNLSSKK